MFFTKKTKKIKPRIGIFDLTDCEGCEVEIVSLRGRLLEILDRIELINWRLGQEKTEWENFDITIIEGTPVTQEEIDLLKYLRGNSKILIALGACASIAGIPGIVDKKDRQKFYEKIYGSSYKPRGIDALPLNAFVKVDFLIHGCPVNPDEVARVFQTALAGKNLKYRGYSVCFECKQEKNPCRLVNKKPCLGPVTQGGCKAICVSGGSPCYGCFGRREDANIEALMTILNRIADKKEIKRYFTMFFNKVACNE
jgi:sulfhydrogenase subunit delta